jgi:hypothetical protein
MRREGRDEKMSEERKRQGRQEKGGQSRDVDENMMGERG